MLLATQLSPVADTFVRNNDYKFVNYGASPFLWVKTQTPSGGDSRVAYLKFNIRDLEADEVGSATLYLTGALQSPNIPSIPVGVFAVDDDSWSAGDGNVSVRRRGAPGGGGSQITGTSVGDGYDTSGGMNWENAPPTGPGPLATARIERDTFHTYAFDLTAHIKDQLQKDNATLSLAVKGDEQTTAFMRFISENFDGTGRPELVVTRAGDPGGSFVRADISVPDLGAGGGTSHAVVVNYSADSPVDLSRLGTDDIRVRRADGAAVQVLSYSADTPFNSSSVNVTYLVDAPGEIWDSADNGTYIVDLPTGAVRDVAGNENGARVAGFRVGVSDVQPPTASLSAAPVTAPGGNSYRFTVNYSDDVAVDAESININNVGVTGQNGTTTLTVTQVELSPDADGPGIAATYTVLAPGGEWDATDNGTYTVTIRNTQVRDTAGRDLSESFPTFQVAIAPPDNQPPVVTSASAPNVTAPGGTSHEVAVIYSDDVAIDVASIDATDIVVSGPRGNLGVNGVQVNQAGDGSPRTVIYTVTPPDGSWDPSDNGDYTITVLGGAVRDTGGNAIAAQTGSFNVNATGTDGSPPGATLSSAPAVNTAGGSAYGFVVTYTDNVAVRASTIEANDVLVLGPGGAPLPVVGVSPDPNGDASSIAVTYTVAAPGGGWGSSDNGQYTIHLNASQVADTSGNVLPGPVQIGGFQVLVAGADNQPPSAQISALPVTAQSGTYTFNVTYADNVGINQATVDRDDVSVTGPGGALTVTSTQTLPAGNGTDLTVTYFVTPPGNSWDGTDNGTYAITVNAGAVTDTSGNGVGGAAAAFNVNLNAPDVVGPRATITAPDVGAPGDTYAVNVQWQDDGAVRVASIDANDILVTRGDVNGPRLTVLSADVTPPNNGSPRTATYFVQPPGGSWDPSDNGDYTVTVVTQEVQDTASHPAQPGAITFRVVVPDNAAPGATVSAANINLEGDQRQQVFVTYQDDVAIDISTLGSDDITVAGPGAVGVLVPVQVFTSSDTNAATVVVTYEIVPPGGTWDVSDNGTYTITVNPGSVKDTVGNSATGSGAFTVSLVGDPPIDVGFNNGNAVNTGFTIEAMTTQPGDEKIILVGRRPSPNVPGGFQAVVQRRMPDGQIDTTFGTNGEVVGDPSSNAIYYAVVVANGGINVAGSADGHWILARYDMTGRPDVAFGAGGRTATTFGAANEAAYAIAVDPRDGDLILAGGTPADPDPGPADQNFAFARYSSTGVPDALFGTNGLLIFDVNGEDVVGALTVLPDGRIMAAGSSGIDIALFRLNANGTPDGAFSGDGFLTISGLQARPDTGFFIDHSQALAIQDGKVLVASRSGDGNFAVARIDPSGNFDSTFGTNGVAVVDFGGTDEDADAIIVQPTGEILVIGTSNSGVGGAPVTAVAALDRSGALITGWNAGGKLTFEPSIAPGAARELRIAQLVLRAFGTRQSDGRLVVGSSDRSPTPTSSAYRKIVVPGVTAQPDGELKGSFGVVDGRRGRKFTVVDADGTAVTFSLKGNATGRVYQSGDRFNVHIDGASQGTVPYSVFIKAKGGDKRFNLGNVLFGGPLRNFNARGADLSGTLYVPGLAGKLVLGNITGTVAAAVGIKSLVAASLTGANILSGANLGSNSELGGAPGTTEGDTFGRGVIGSIRVAGRITGSTIAAGLNPIDDTIGDDDDIVVGGIGDPGGPFSVIRTISAKGGADETSQFIAGGFGKVVMPRRIDPAKDPQGRFRVM